ncbi:MAG: hypothetical protein KGJ60_14200 [Verrucomicrobiota bacterium]|nr:hypothetical protein [Verrucomicrobiota bacterium]
MKPKGRILALTCFFASLLPLRAQTNMAAIFPNEGSSSSNFMLVWPTTPGVRYEVRQSTNLQSWSTVPGFPATANGPVQQMPLVTTNAAAFFQVRQLDEQPPAIVSQFPKNGGFAVSPTANLTIQLSDATGIDTNSIQLAVGDLGTFSLTNAQLTFSNDVLTFNDGSIALGDYGTNVQLTLVAADILGNIGTNTWSFTLELQPQVATNLFVFGSPQAQRLGQVVGEIPTAALARRLGPVPQVPLAGGNSWILMSVVSNCLVISYTNTAPGFATNTYVCNLTPTTTNEIFYRNIVATSNNPVKMLLTLFTTNVPLAQIISQGSASISSNSVIYNLNTNGTIKSAISFNQTLALPTLGADLSGDTIYDNSGVTLKLDQGYWLFTPSLHLAFQTSGFSLQRFEADFIGDMNAALVPELTFSGALQNDTSFDLFSQNYEVFLGTVGVVPIWVSLGFDLQAQLGYSLSANATMSTGIRQDMNVTCGAQYDRNASPTVSPVFSLNLPRPELVPFTYNINGSGSAFVALVPEVSARVESLAGVEANVNPKVTVSGQATDTDGQLASASWSILADAYLNLGLSVIGIPDSDMPTLASIKLFSWQWSSSYPQPTQLTIQTQPQSENVAPGSSASFSVDAAASQPISYQWYFNGMPIPGQTAQTLLLSDVNYGDAGDYSVRVSAGSQTTISIPSTLVILSGVNGGVPIGFNGNGVGWMQNQSGGPYTGTPPFVANNRLVLTDGNGNEDRSFFYKVPQYIGSFKASFTYEDVGGDGITNSTADGFTFIVQNSDAGANALGGLGSALGYSYYPGLGTNIIPSAELCFALYNNGDNAPGIAWATNGAPSAGISTTGFMYSSTAPVSIISGDPIDVSIDYNGNVFAVTLSDEITKAAFSTNIVVGSLPQIVNGDTAFVGFTGASGGVASTQTIANFGFYGLVPDEKNHP